MAITNITPEKIEKLKKKSVLIMPNNPSERGLTPAAIKKLLTDPLFNVDDSIISEINRIVEDVNIDLESKQEILSLLDSKIQTFEETINNAVETLGDRVDAVESNISGLDNRLTDLENSIDTTGKVRLFYNGESTLTGGAEQAPEYDHNAPELHQSGVIPEGGAYTIKATGEVLVAGMNFPEASAKNDTYTYGDYKYTYEVKTTREGWKVTAIDLTKENYEPILESINGINIVSLAYCFMECFNLVECPVIPANVQSLIAVFRDCPLIVLPPLIPDTANDLAQMFKGCINLTTAPDISHLKNLIYLDATFRDCTSLATYVKAPKNTASGDFSYYVIPDTVENMSSTFYNCTKLIGAPTIPASVTNMTNTFYGCSNMTKTVICHANPTKYDWAFKYTKVGSIIGDCVKTGANGNLWATK